MNGVSLDSVKHLLSPSVAGSVLVADDSRAGCSFQTAPVAGGGLGIDASATGGAGQIVRQNTVGTFTVGLPLFNRRAVADAAIEVAATDQLVAATGVTAPRAITLPLASTMAGQRVSVKDETGNANTHNLTVTRSGSDTIDGATTYVISTNYGFATFYSNGTNWFRIG